MKKLLFIALFILLLALPVCGQTTVLLTHANGTDASTTLTDETGNHTWTAQDNAQLDTAEKKFGSASILLDGTDDRFTTGDSTYFNVGSDDWTLDLWAYANSLTSSSTNPFFKQADSGPTAASRNFQVVANEPSSGHKLSFSVWTTGATRKDSSLGSTTISTGTWHHIAVVRDGTTITGYLNGTSECTISISTDALQDATGTIAIGSLGEYLAGPEWDGWIDEVRFVNDTAMWTTNFTPATEEYTLGSTRNRMIIFSRAVSPGFKYQVRKKFVKIDSGEYDRKITNYWFTHKDI